MWDELIEQYPKIFMGYVKVTDNQAPIRIETLNYPANLISDFSYILLSQNYFLTMVIQ